MIEPLTLVTESMAASRHWTPIFEDIKLEQTTSTMFSMLPTSLQSRLPPLRSVRKSVSMQTLKTPSATQPPSHGPTRSLSRIDAVPLAPSSELVGEDVEGEMRLVVGRDSPPPEYPSTPLIEEPVDAATPRLPSGVHWRYAQQGKTNQITPTDEMKRGRGARELCHPMQTETDSETTHQASRSWR